MARVRAQLGLEVRDVTLLRNALHHRSAPLAGSGATEAYERLEWLGDAVLGACRGGGWPAVGRRRWGVGGGGALP